MKKGFLATLFAAAVSFAGTQAALAVAPTIQPFPDIQIGDMEDNPVGGSDNNFFIFTNAFQLSTHVTDSDSTAGQMLWSFAEYYDAGAPYSDSQQEFQVNGKNPIAVGITAVANETSNSYPNAKNPGANQINLTSDWATFRDILFSPTNQTAPFVPAVTPTQSAYSATVGKNVVLYVRDQDQNVAQDVIKVKTKDQDFDKVSQSTTIVFDQGNPSATGSATTTMGGWVESGLNATSGDVTAQPGGGTAFDDVDRTDNTNAINPATPSTTATDLGTIVRASSHRYRILGWTNPTGVSYPGAGSYLRGKFYVYTNNAAADAVNKYPNFRARLQNGGAQDGAVNVGYSSTGNSGGNTGDGSLDYASFNDPASEISSGQYLKPSRLSTKPSLYRVDYDPVDVPAAGAQPIQPTWEAFAFQDPAAATIYLAQCTILTYPALTDAAGAQIFAYNRATTAASQGIQTVDNVTVFSGRAFGGFNVENNFTFGYRQHLFIGSNNAVETEAAGTTGLMIDTGAGNTAENDKFIVGIVDAQYSANASKARIQSGKLYRGRFYATSDVVTTAASAATEKQGNIRFRLQSADGVISCYNEIQGGGLQNKTAYNTGSDANYRDNVIAGQALPGVNSVNPEFDGTLTPAGFDGGWYTVMMDTPLDLDIRRDVGGTIASAFGNLAAAPGPGSSLPATATFPSSRDIKTGIDAYTVPKNLQIGATLITGYADANRAKVATTAIKLFEYDQIDDGTYPY